MQKFSSAKEHLWTVASVLIKSIHKQYSCHSRQTETKKKEFTFSFTYFFSGFV